MPTRVLDISELQEVLQNTRTRGEYFTIANDFLNSGELYIDFSERFPNVASASLKNSVTSNVKKIRAERNGNMPEYKIVTDQNKHVLLINMDVYNLAQQQNEA